MNSMAWHEIDHQDSTVYHSLPRCPLCRYFLSLSAWKRKYYSVSDSLHSSRQNQRRRIRDWWMPPKASGGGAAPRRGPSQPQQQQPGSNDSNSILKKPNAVAVNKDNTAQQQQQGDSRNKVVVRRCPPELPEAVFWQSVEPWIKDDAADWKMVSFASS